MNNSAPALNLAGVTKRHRENTLLDNICLQVEAGQIYGLLGPNGAGKSTLMKIIAGLVRPTAGTVTIFGIDASLQTPELRRLVGIVPQDSNLERELTVPEALTVYGRLFGLEKVEEKVEETIARFSLEGMRQKRVGRLSGGMMRRVLIARALLPEPELLLMDEPTVGLDPDVRQEIWQIIQALTVSGKTILLTTHYMEEAARLCAHIALLKAGRLALVATPDEIQRRYGGDVSNEEALETLFIQLAKGGID
ncbi:Nod factor export ATP-binding protein I [Acetonema longum DSM 6540]|uniref:Nod factor export ATP-binding protein I n=2 Tax=Acetonema TaxID=2373 RepID=F7NN17_9FIRM|nr:Nod factor export ATP-binding protein I [Acetonema longum DSM 6540]